MTGLLVRYNKVHDDALAHLGHELKKQCKVSWTSLPDEHLHSIDLLPYQLVHQHLSSFLPLNFIVIGDVFWPTGQNICRWAQECGVSVFFLQHGQWIYTRNKKKLPYYPDHTLFFGDDVCEMSKKWAYGQASNCLTTGSPRYDDTKTGSGPYIYFAPPVIEEIVHNKSSGTIKKHWVKALSELKGIDKHLPLVIQPHYRESRTDWLHELFPVAQFADPSLDPLKLIRGSSKVMTHRSSTSVLDAIAHKKKAILMNFSETGLDFFPRGYFEDFAIETTGKKDLIRKSLEQENSKRNDYINRSKRYIYLGNASVRISEIIKNNVSLEMYNTA